MDITNRATKTMGQQVYELVRARYPDAYITPGVGWCGPQWLEAEAMARSLDTYGELEIRTAFERIRRNR